jgi:ADP-dependent NAD(P)H-hydrate dehydratase / NAD(P)H-hydrate epimerase
MKLALAQQMRTLDSAAINEFGIPGIVLMENAGRKTCDMLIELYGNPEGKKVVVFAGPGNNGGDAFVVARHLHQNGADVIVNLLVQPEEISGDAKTNLNIVQKLPIPLHVLVDSQEIDSLDFSRAFLIVDGLFGTGLKREITGRFAKVINDINKCTAPTVSLDIPSGMDSDSGQRLGACVHADVTYTYGLAKPGQFSYPGKVYCGDIKVVDIGIPPEVIENAQLYIELLGPNNSGCSLPGRVPDGHKGSHGHLLIIGGSPGKTGAAILAAKGGLRSGSGLVSMCVSQSSNDIYESALHEAMTITVTGSENSALDIDDYPTIKKAISGKSALVVGPGIGLAEGSCELVKKIYNEASMPLVIDADGLNALATDAQSIQCEDKDLRILTPHPGEMARLTGMSTKEIQENRIEITRDFSMRNNVYVILKGAATIVGAPDGRIAVNSSGNPGMGTGGMGDVLAGIIGGLLAQKLSAWNASCLGVYVHGLAADHIAQTMKQGYLATEVADTVPVMFNTLYKY